MRRFSQSKSTRGIFSREIIKSGELGRMRSKTFSPTLSFVIENCNAKRARKKSYKLNLSHLQEAGPKNFTDALERENFVSRLLQHSSASFFPTICRHILPQLRNNCPRSHSNKFAKPLLARCTYNQLMERLHQVSLLWKKESINGLKQKLSLTCVPFSDQSTWLSLDGCCDE